MLEILSYSVCKLWHKIQIHINTDFAFTGLMLCVIPHIRKNAKYNSYSDHRQQVNNVNKKLFHAIPEDEMAVTQDIFWTEYTDFDNKNDSFYADEFIWKSQDSRYGNIHLWHQKYSLPCTMIIGFVACRGTSKVLGIGAAEHSWGDVNTIKYGKIYAIISDVLEKHGIVYTLPVLNQLELNNITMTNNLMKIVQVIPGMNRMMILINS